MNLQPSLSAIQTELATVILQIYRDSRARQRDIQRDRQRDRERLPVALTLQSRQSLLQSFCRFTEITQGQREITCSPHSAIQTEFATVILQIYRDDTVTEIEGGRQRETETENK